MSLMSVLFGFFFLLGFRNNFVLFTNGENGLFLHSTQSSVKEKVGSRLKFNNNLKNLQEDLYNFKERLNYVYTDYYHEELTNELKNKLNYSNLTSNLLNNEIFFKNFILKIKEKNHKIFKRNENKNFVEKNFINVNIDKPVTAELSSGESIKYTFNSGRGMGKHFSSQLININIFLTSIPNYFSDYASIMYNGEEQLFINGSFTYINNDDEFASYKTTITSSSSNINMQKRSNSNSLSSYSSDNIPLYSSGTSILSDDFNYTTTRGFLSFSLSTVRTLEFSITAPNITSDDVNLLASKLNLSLSNSLLSNNPKWTYTFYLTSFTSSGIGYIDKPQALYLADTDNYAALFVTSGLSKMGIQYSQVGNDTHYSNVTMLQNLNLYALNSSIYYALNNSGLANSYTALITAPHELTNANADLSFTTRGTERSLKRQFYLKGLQKSTPYFVYIAVTNIDSQVGTLYAPINFTSASSDSCQVIYDLDFCDQVAYAVPANKVKYSAESLANLYDETTSAYYKNFTLSMEQIQCNASLENSYSPFRNCTDCRNSYKNWLCSTSIPRCSIEGESVGYFRTREPKESRGNTINDFIDPEQYIELLPCIELCYQVMQDCPTSLGFQCPILGKGLESSYGYMSKNGSLTCSYPGAVYSTSLGTRVEPSFIFILIIGTIYFIIA